MIGGAHEFHADDHNGDQQGQVQPVTCRQQQRLPTEYAAEFAVGNHRAGKGHGADSDADVDFDLVDRFFDAAVLDRGIEKIGDADQHRREPDKAVQNGDQFRHLRHLHAARQDKADNAAGDHDSDQPFIVARYESGDRYHQRDTHADDTEQVAASGGVVGAEAAESEDK